MKYAVIAKTDNYKFVYKDLGNKSSTRKKVWELETSGINKRDIEILPVKNSVNNSIKNGIAGCIVGIILGSIVLKLIEKRKKKNDNILHTD